MKLGRHSRSKQDWGGGGARSRERAKAAQDDPSKARVPAKKPRDKCKGAHWKGPHAPGLRIRQWGWLGDKECHWGASWTTETLKWTCYHEEACSECGKILRTGLDPGECPLYHEVTDQEQAIAEAQIARRGLISSQRKVSYITGPQGYRRKRNKPG